LNFCQINALFLIGLQILYKIYKLEKLLGFVGWLSHPTTRQTNVAADSDCRLANARSTFLAAELGVWRVNSCRRKELKNKLWLKMKEEKENNNDCRH